MLRLHCWLTFSFVTFPLVSASSRLKWQVCVFARLYHAEKTVFTFFFFLLMKPWHALPPLVLFVIYTLLHFIGILSLLCFVLCYGFVAPTLGGKRLLALLVEQGHVLGKLWKCTRVRIGSTGFRLPPARPPKPRPLHTSRCSVLVSLSTEGAELFFGLWLKHKKDGCNVLNLSCGSVRKRDRKVYRSLQVMRGVCYFLFILVSFCQVSRCFAVIFYFLPHF